MLKLLTLGQSNAEIAKTLVVGDATVMTHVSHVRMRCLEFGRESAGGIFHEANGGSGRLIGAMFDEEFLEPAGTEHDTFVSDPNTRTRPWSGDPRTPQYARVFDRRTPVG